MFILADAATSINDSNTANTDSTFLKNLLNQFIDWVIEKGVEILLTLLFLYIGKKVINLILKLAKKYFKKSKNISLEVEHFLISVIKIILYCTLYLAAIGMLGFQITSLVTVLGSASIAIGLALQGSFSNLAGGVLILILKPFVIGDYIVDNTSKCEGTVKKIEIFYTTLITYDNKKIVIPNGTLSQATIINLTAEAKRRVEISFGVAYMSDLKKVREVLCNMAKESGYVLQEEPVNVIVNDFKDSSIEMQLRFWVKTEDYWNAKFEMTEAVKDSFDHNGITIPFNQLEVKIKE